MSADKAGPLGRSGNVAIEFALISPVLVLMLMGLLSYGLPVYYRMELENSVHAAAQYMNATSDSDLTTLTNIVQTASRLSGIVVDPPKAACRCASSTVDEDPCPSTCGDGSSVAHYWTITAHYTYSPLVTFFDGDTEKTLTYSMSIRTTQ